jgi:hypothetical protein
VRRRPVVTATVAIAEGVRAVVGSCRTTIGARLGARSVVGGDGVEHWCAVLAAGRAGGRLRWQNLSRQNLQLLLLSLLPDTLHLRAKMMREFRVLEMLLMLLLLRLRVLELLRLVVVVVRGCGRHRTGPGGYCSTRHREPSRA